LLHSAGNRRGEERAAVALLGDGQLFGPKARGGVGFVEGVERFAAKLRINTGERLQRRALGLFATLVDRSMLGMGVGVRAPGPSAIDVLCLLSYGFLGEV